jgi:flagellar capping protein FliD
MSDVYIPGVKSRFNTETLIEDLMKVERVPKDRAEKNVESLETQKGYWQEVGRRIGSLRESSRLLYSFQNPFNERIARSSDESVITGTASREAVEQEQSFTVQQIAKADRFLSAPQEESFRVAPGNYSFTVGQDEISLNFRGGTLKEFADALNRRGRDKIQASLITVQPGTKSLLIESLVTGSENRLGFAGASEELALQTGMVERISNSRQDISVESAVPGTDGQLVSVQDDVLTEVTGDFRPRNPVSVAQDALVSMDGIEIQRPTNTISDLIPGVTLTARGISDRPVTIGIEPDREAVKDAIISLVGNYNRLMAEINVLTRSDSRIIDELSYLSTEEQEGLRKRMGVFSGDTTLNQFKNTMQRAASSPYPTRAEQELSLLAQIGVGTDVRRAGSTTGYDASRMRGYLEIDEKNLDAALTDKLSVIQQLFGSDTDGDLITDSGVAYALETLAKPYVETGGILSLKTGTIDSRITQEQRRIATMDQQLVAKEAALKKQYGQMEGAFNRMDRMSTSLDQFSQRANNTTRQ